MTFISPKVESARIELGGTAFNSPINLEHVIAIYRCEESTGYGEVKYYIAFHTINGVFRWTFGLGKEVMKSRDDHYEAVLKAIGS